MKKQPKINQPLVQLFGHVDGISTGKMKMDLRIKVLHPFGCRGQEPDGIALPCADIHIAGHCALAGGQLPSRLIHQIDDLLCPFTQKHPILCQSDPPAPPQKEGLTQLLLQFPQLPGERGLGRMQRLRRPGDILLSGHRQKIPQDPQFHSPPLLFLSLNFRLC